MSLRENTITIRQLAEQRVQLAPEFINMLGRAVREQLSQDLRKLVTGRMTNDEFDEAFCKQYYGSCDAGVSCIAGYASCLYHSDTLRPYRLRGRYSVDPITRRTVARCVLFIRTTIEYDWPKEPRSLAARVLYSFAWIGIPCSIALLICSLPLLLIGDFGFGGPIAVLALAILTTSLRYLLSPNGFKGEYYSAEWRAWRASGDYDVWPFRRREDFYDARRTAHLLGAGQQNASPITMVQSSGS